MIEFSAKAEAVIGALNLEPHLEGGYFVEPIRQIIATHSKPPAAHGI